ncbi:TPA: hypothetical protein ACGO2S_001047 [Streptococcus suis]
MRKVSRGVLTILISATVLSACSGGGQELSERLEAVKIEFSKEKKQLEAELTALKEEVQGNFYYQQLDTDKERRVYLQFVNGLSKRMQVIDIDSVNDEIYSRVYFSVAHDYPEFYWLTDEAAMSGGVDILDLEEPAYPTDLSPTRNKIERGSE